MSRNEITDEIAIDAALSFARRVGVSSESVRGIMQQTSSQVISVLVEQAERLGDEGTSERDIVEAQTLALATILKGYTERFPPSDPTGETK